MAEEPLAVPDMVLRFEGFELDLARGELRRDGAAVELPPLTFRLIRYLAMNRERTVSADELLEEIWQGLAVSEAALHQALRQARLALGDDGKRQAVIRTVRGGGYRFVAGVSVAEEGAAAGRVQPYIGREALLTRLERHLDEALRGHGRVVLLSGEAGIGKTRTLAELEQLALARGVQIARGAGNPLLGAPPFWPWLQVFRDLSASRPVQRLRQEVEALAPGLLGGSSATAEGQHALPSSNGRRFRLFDAASRCLHHASALGPLLVILDDLHDAGGATLELLDFVAQDIARAPLLVLGAYRPLGPIRSGDGVVALARLEERRVVDIVPVEGLSEVEAKQLIVQGEERPLPLVLVEALTVRARGNPFYLRELARLLGGEVSAHEPEEWAALIPRGTQRLISQRLAALTGSARELLRQASVLGTTLDQALLDSAAGGAASQAALDECFRLGFLTESNPGAPQLSFSHSLVRDAIYAEIGPAERRSLHLRAAEAMLDAPPERLVEAAFHMAEAAPLGDVGRAVDFLRRAGDQARTVFDFEQALRLYRRALELLDRWPIADQAARCELLIAAGEVAVRGDFVEEGRAALQDAMALARRVHWAEPFARAALSHAYASDYLAAANEQVVELLEEALAMEGDGPSALRARLLSRLAVEVRYQRPDSEHALALLRESVALARASEDPGVLARVLEDSSYVRWSVDDREHWLGLNREIVLASEQARDYDLLFQGVKGLATAHMELGDRAAMEREVERCRTLATEFPAPYQKAAMLSMNAARHFLDGDFERAERAVVQALSAGLPAATPPALSQLYYHRLETGRIGELEERLRGVAEEAPDVVGWRYALARLLVELGRYDEAALEIAAARDPAQAPRDRTWLMGVAMLAESLCEIHDEERARSLFELLRPYAGVNIVGGSASIYCGNVGHFVGMLGARLGRLDEADELLSTGQREHERMRAIPWILHSRLEKSRLLRLRGDDAKAGELAADVRGQAEALGMWSVAKRAARDT